MGVNRGTRGNQQAYHSPSSTVQVDDEWLVGEYRSRLGTGEVSELCEYDEWVNASWGGHEALFTRRLSHIEKDVLSDYIGDITWASQYGVLPGTKEEKLANYLASTAEPSCRKVVDNDVIRIRRKTP